MSRRACRSFRGEVLGSALLLFAVASDAAADGLKGRAAGPARALVGASITAQGASGVATTVYAGPDGRFEIRHLESGKYNLRVRYPGFEDANLEAATGSAAIDVALRPAADKLMLAPSSTWLSLLPDGVMKRRFIVNCAACHEIPHSRIYKDGVIRNEGKWAETIAMMKALDAYKLVSPALDAKTYAPWLAEHLSPQAIAALEPQRAADVGRVGRAVITEYTVPTPTELPHDLALGPDRRVWITAFWTGFMWALDPMTGRIESFDVAKDKSTPAQVRALQFDRSGKLWIVLGGTKSVVRLDPKTREIRTFPVGIYAHDIVLDSKGDVWLNDYFSNPEAIAKLEVATGKVTHLLLPSAHLPAAEGQPLPYGLQIDREDRLWSTQLVGNTLVRFDTRTGQSKLYRMPVAMSGPRRHAIAKDGAVWIPEFNTGFIARFDPRTERFERFRVGEGALGAYDLAIDPRDGGVWITGSLASALIRFDPGTHAIERYPLPTEPAYMRHIAIDPDTGDVWSAYSSLPTVVPKVVRVRRAG
jgi:virginiamycin B lyase